MIGERPTTARRRRARIRLILAVLTGGITEAELRRAGTTAVYESVADLARRLKASPLGR